MHKKLSILVVLVCLFAGMCSGCSGCSKSQDKSDTTAVPPTDSEQKTDSESGSETGTRGDTTSETGDSETDTLVVVDTDSASESGDDTGTVADTGTTVAGTDSADTGSDSDTDNPWLPPGCEIVTSYRGDWTGENAFYGDLMVWGEQTPTDCQVITVRKLSTKEHIPVTDCDYMQKSEGTGTADCSFQRIIGPGIADCHLEWLNNKTLRRVRST